MWKNVPVWETQRDLLKRLLCSSRKRETMKEPSHLFWAPGRRANPRSGSPLLQTASVHLSKLTEPRLTKGWEIHPAAAFSGLNPAGQAATTRGLHYAPEFPLQGSRPRRVYGFLSRGSGCKPSGGGAGNSVENPRNKIILQTPPCQDFSNRSKRQTVRF